MVLGDGGVRVESTPGGTDSFVADAGRALLPSGGGGPITGSFVFEGSNAWLMEGKDRGAAASARLAAEPWSLG